MPKRKHKRNSASGVPKNSHKAPTHPPHLQGKAIGLFYRDLSKKNKQNKEDTSRVITFRLPSAVAYKVRLKLQSIAQIAESLNIPIYQLKKNVPETIIIDETGIDEDSKKHVPDTIIVEDETNIDDDSKKYVSETIIIKDETGINGDSKKRVSETIIIKDETDIDEDSKKHVSETIIIKDETDIDEDSKKHVSETIIIKDEAGIDEDSKKHVLGTIIIKDETGVDEDSKKHIPETIIIEDDTSIDVDTKKHIPEAIITEDDSIDVVTKKPIEWCPLKEDQKISDIEDTKDNIKRSPNLEDDDQSKKVESKNPQKSDDVFKLPNPVSIKQCFQESPSSSSTPDFIPISNKDPTAYGSVQRQLSFRGGGDYKYGYNDIITGTFDEKLEECLMKGVGIDKNTDEVKEINTALRAEYIAMQQKSGYRRMLQFRQRLPAYQKSQDLLHIVNNNQVVVISGETGCGKSTQVPQIILDNAIDNNCGGNVKILVTQPRRIAASSLAARVSEERGEKAGNSVGYAVRLERIDARERGSIFFCTTGILLADLETDQGLTKYSHIILDEVHERDSHIDLSMCMLKRVLKKRKNLKLILMSATLDAERLTEYFDNCPMLHIEGLAYPVQDIYLENILQMTKYQLPPMQFNNQPKWAKYRNKGKNQRDTMKREIQHRAEIGPWLETIKRNIDRGVYHTLLDPRSEDLNVDLICHLLIHICRGPPGAILVFLPGIGEITKLINVMDGSQMFPSNRFEIYPLHSKLPSLEQHKIFERPPGHIRKIIIATNIAETSITIDDIVYVVDCGKIKLSGLNVEENLSTLKVEWVSQANLRQRRGRAGRCQPGVCYHMLTSYRASKLAERLLPELQRSNLLEPVLTIKRLRLGKAVDALNLVPSPPAESTVKWAVKHLQQCGGLDDNETLTPLGWHLARLPVHPSAGKLLLLGALFGCLDRAASVAAVWGFKDPFQIVIGKEREVDQAKRFLALGEPSDHIAISEAIIGWENCPRHNRKSFAYDNFLSNNTLELLSDMKKQLGDSLKQMGFLSSADVKSSWENRNSFNLSLFKAIVAASLYPNIATVRWTNLPNKNWKKNRQARIKVHTPDMIRPVSVHPSSVMTPPKFLRHGEAVPLCTNPGANWLVYWLKQKSSDLFLFEVTLVYTLPLLFFGELKVTVEEDKTSANNCLMSILAFKVRCERETADMLFQLRSLLDHVLASKVMVSSQHTTRHNDFEELVLNAVIELITAEDEGAEYLGDDDSHSESDTSDYEPNNSWR